MPRRSAQRAPAPAVASRRSARLRTQASPSPDPIGNPEQLSCTVTPTIPDFEVNLDESEDESDFEDVEIPDPPTLIPAEPSFLPSTAGPVNPPVVESSPGPYDPYAAYLENLEDNDNADDNSNDDENGQGGIVLTFGAEDFTTAKGSSNPGESSPSTSKGIHITKKDRIRRHAVHRAQVLCDLIHLGHTNKLMNCPTTQAVALSLVPEHILNLIQADQDLPSQRAKKRSKPNPTASPLPLQLNGLRNLVDWWCAYFRVEVPRVGPTRTSLLDQMNRLGVNRLTDPTTHHNSVSKLSDPANRESRQRDVILSALGAGYGTMHEGTLLLGAICRALGLRTRLVRSLYPLPTRFTREELARELQGEVWLALPDLGVVDPKNTISESPQKGSYRQARYHPLTWWLEVRLPGPGKSHWWALNTIHGIMKHPQAVGLAPLAWIPPSQSDSTTTTTTTATTTTTTATTVEAVVEKSVGGSLTVPLVFTDNSKRFPVVYVVAMDEQGYWKDVTRRYTSEWSKVTRNLRAPDLSVGSSGNLHPTHNWWIRLMAYRRAPHSTESDHEEEVALSQQEFTEKVPTSLAGFKNHPHFALERHLKQSEIIHPRQPCLGQIRGETIFPRSHVHMLKSKETWYREGRELQSEQTPLKHIKGRPSIKSRNSGLGGSRDDEQFERDVYWAIRGRPTSADRMA
ncbi:hypothetical protein BJ085DRAFT_34697, partial [Dimargaris cristalligena]